MKLKYRVLPWILLVSALWLTAVSAAAATRFSDGVYTFEKTGNDTAVITDCNLTESDIEVPGLVLGYTVTGIGDYAFLSNSYISSVVLPSSVVSIGKYAFAENQDLAYVTIPESCTEITDNAFFNSPNVTIRCCSGSAADTFAQEHNIPCAYINDYLLGDADGDGMISISDVTTIQRYLAEEVQLEGVRLLAANTNGDEVADISDATALQMFLSEYAIPYPIGERFFS